MKRVFISIITVLGFLNIAFGQFISSVTEPDTSQPVIKDKSLPTIQLAETITAKDLKGHLSILASDEFEGRETGEAGNEMAAEYIALQFQRMGLPPVVDDGYFQDVYFNKTSWKENKLIVNGNEYKHLWDYLGFATVNDGMPDFSEDEVVFLGYGIDDEKYSDYENRDLQGKIIMINEGEPLKKDSISYITGTAETSDWSRSIWKKLETAQSKGVKMVFVISEDLKSFLNKNRRFLVSPSLRLGDGKISNRKYANHLYISSSIAKEIISKKAKKIKRWRKKNRKKAKTKAIVMPVDLQGTFEKNIDLIAGHNVLGYIEGTDKKDEIVVVSAHYDHLGKRGNDVYNGADDNASGTSTVLEIAEALAKAKKQGKGPRRSVLCLLVTGEEKGLLGSEYYAENPVFPLENTMVDVNVDMVGRTDKRYGDNSNYIYVIGSDRLSADLHTINEEVNQNYTQLTLDYKYNDEKDPNRYYFRSDHYNFAKNGIPSIFFFSGVHEDYHMITDTVEKIMFPKMEKVGRHTFHLIWELANREEAITVTVDTKGE
jgi:hypothetical protein